MAPTNLQYFDTSSLTKVLVEERGTAFMRQTLESSTADTVLVSALQQVELRSSIARRLSRQELTPDEAASSMEAIDDLLRLFTILPVDDTVLSHAAVLVRTTGLRSLDAIQLASTLSISAQGPPVTFVASDRKLLAAAQANGLATLNPEDADTVE